jgi:tetraacyldisaccharide 4'-kinase
MRGERLGPGPRALLYAASLAYGLGVRARLFSYRSGILPTHRIPAKVVSVGNLTVGGTGKTPVTIFLAEFFRKDGKKAAVLSRGYGGSARGVSVVSDDEGVLMDPAGAGDEPYLMATRLPGVPVVVSPDRVKAGLFALERFAPDVVILDDAFQHVRLERDINIVLMDSKEGFGNGYLLPRGVLREPVSGLKRADFALVKGGKPEGSALELLRKHSVPYIAFSYRPDSLYDIDSGKEVPLESLKGQRVAAVSGIANPGSFLKSLEDLGCLVSSSLEFPDHHSYTEGDSAAIAEKARGADLVVATEKDGVKLRGTARRTPVFALRVKVDIDRRILDSSLAPVLRGVL